MGNPNYAQKDLDELFAALKVAVIKDHEAFVKCEPLKVQHQLTDIYAEIYEESKSRGAEALQHYIPLLTAEHPALRLAAALGLLKTAPGLAVPVLEELSVGKYGVDIGMNAHMMLDAMRKSGEMPPPK